MRNDATIDAGHRGKIQHDLRRTVELLDAVYENPADDAARRVYADHLVAQGDPRGELIMLQCERAARSLPISAERREVELLWKYGRAWLGPFAKAIGAFRFERGFLAECELKQVTRKMIGDPSWATVERIRLKAADAALVAVFLSDPGMRALRDVSGVGPKAFATLCEPGMGGGIETLEVAGAPRISVELARSKLGLQRLTSLRYS
jgi:uncharacterized protein (TIGR02996 family)